MSENYYALIMAGGGGTRLWPLSRRARPKQMLRLIDERTLFQMSVERLEGLFPPERIFVVTAASQVEALREQTPQIIPGNFIQEPQPRGTASAVGLATALIQHRDPDAILAVLTADHYIAEEAVFLEILQEAAMVAKDGFLVTLGITPTFAATGFGYIQQGTPLESYPQGHVFHVARFKEKPQEQEAQAMLQSGDYSWNSGMFIGQTAAFMAEFKRQMPVLTAALDEIVNAQDTPQADVVLQRQWLGLESQTIDYGIMERAEQIAVIPAAGLGWNDVGSWDSLFDVLEANAQGNISNTPLLLDEKTSNSLFYTTNKERLIVSIGVKDLVVVDTEDVLLICTKNQAQEVREIIKQLKESQQESYL